MKCLHLMDHQWLIHSNKIKQCMNSRSQLAHQPMLSHKERPSGLAHRVLLAEDQRHRSLVTDQDKPTSIHSDHSTNSLSIFHLLMELILTPFRTVTELQASWTGTTRIRGKLVKVWWSKSSIMLWEIILRKSKSSCLANSWSLKLRTLWRENRNSLGSNGRVQLKPWETSGQPCRRTRRTTDK